MTVMKITPQRLREKATEYVKGTKDIEPSFLLTGAFETAILPRKKLADIIGVQVNQVGKFTSPKNSMTKKAAKALAEAIIAAP